MKNFADRLVDAIQQKKSRVVVGLDPRLESLPEAFKHGTAKDIERAGKAVLDFNGALIDIVKDHAVAVKPQIAFYEKLGPYGVVAYFATCKHARDNGLLVIGDVKRGDIDSTAQAYARAFLDPSVAGSAVCDAITVNPYLGADAVEPFIEACRAHAAGLFVLVRTSNKHSGLFQDHGSPRLYEHVARAVDSWGSELVGQSGLSSVGAVVGATHPAELAALREIGRAHV